MALVGFHFDKMLIEKKKPATGKVNISNNIVMTEIKEATINMGANKQQGVEFNFHFKSRYEPGVASIDLLGAVVYTGSKEIVTEVLEKWSKDKKLVPKVMEEVYNHLLGKCNIQAFIMEKEMNLPPHIPLQKVTYNQEEKEE